MNLERKVALSLVFGIIGLILFWPLGILAIYLGYSARKNGVKGKKPVIGIILGIIAIIGGIFAHQIVTLIVYPTLGRIFNTNYPIVNFVSESMGHNSNFDDWWNSNGKWYTDNGISKELFINFPLQNGVNRGDLAIIEGAEPDKIQMGDVIIFWSGKKEPIPHRVIKKWIEGNETYFGTKGDHNPGQIKTETLDETKINSNQIIGKVVFRIPYLGYPKIWVSGT